MQIARQHGGSARPETEDAKLLPLDKVRSRLAVVWIFGFCLVFALVALQSLIGRYGDHIQAAWSWLMPNLMPTVGTIVAGLGYTALDAHGSRSMVRVSYYRLSGGLSIFYLTLLLLTILIAPTLQSGVTGKGAVDLMHTANLWLGPLQGLVATALGVLFASQRKARVPDAAREGDDERPPAPQPRAKGAASGS